MTATFSSPHADGSACIASGSTSQACWPVKSSASRKSTTAFGSPASCATISDTSTWNRKPCNLSTTRSARGCHPCLRYDLSPMCPGWTKLGIKEVDDGIWLASFMRYDLGYFDLEQKTLQPLDNPFGTRLSPMS